MEGCEEMLNDLNHGSWQGGILTWVLTRAPLYSRRVVVGCTVSLELCYPPA